MAESIAGVRLARNLKYKLTYVKIFEQFLETSPGLDVTELLQSLIQAQQTAISALASTLRRLDVGTQDLELNDKLIDQAGERSDVKSQLRFICDGLERAVAWYKMQLTDRQMVGDPELRRLLFELGQLEAAKLFHTEAVMAMLRVPRQKDKELEPPQPTIDPARQEGWRPRLMDDMQRPSWTSDQPRWQGPRRPRPRGRERGG